METRRQTAVKARASDIINSRFVRKEGLEPSYVLTDLGQRIARVKLIGTVIDKFFSENGSFSSATISDDTGAVRVKAFQDNATIFNNLDLGDMVLVIGKVREYAEENYVIPEIVKKIADPNYETLHKLEVLKAVLEQRKAMETIVREKDKFSDLEELKNYLSKEYGIDFQTSESVFEALATEEGVKEKDFKPLVLELIAKLDKGRGVEITKLIGEINLPENVFEEVITEMLSDGMLYESSPGVVRVA